MTESKWIDSSLYTTVPNEEEDLLEGLDVIEGAVVDVGAMLEVMDGVAVAIKYVV